LIALDFDDGVLQQLFSVGMAAVDAEQPGEAHFRLERRRADGERPSKIARCLRPAFAGIGKHRGRTSRFRQRLHDRLHSR
jgi:hypothetical protein